MFAYAKAPANGNPDIQAETIHVIRRTEFRYDIRQKGELT